MPLAGFEPAIPSIKRPQTYAFDRTVTGIGILKGYSSKISVKYLSDY
jgi:hypothetical protein